MDYQPFLPIMVALILSISAGVFYLSYKSARKKEKNIDPAGVLSVRESKATLAIGIISVVLFGFAAVGVIILNVTQGFTDGVDIFVIELVVFTFFALLGVYLIIFWKAWEIRLEGEAITLRRLFRKDVVIALSDISRTEPPVLISMFGEVRIYDYSEKMLFKIRTTLRGYPQLHGRILAALSAQGFSSASYQQQPQGFPNAPFLQQPNQQPYQQQTYQQQPYQPQQQYPPPHQPPMQQPAQQPYQPPMQQPAQPHQPPPVAPQQQYPTPPPQPPQQQYPPPPQPPQ